MIEYQVVVNKTKCGITWYTLQKRKWYFLFSLWWQDVNPTMQATYEDCMILKREKEKNEL